MLLGELGPKNLAIARPLPVAAAVAPGMRAFTRVTGVVVHALQGLANAIVRGWLRVRARRMHRETTRPRVGATELADGPHRRAPRRAYLSSPRPPRCWSSLRACATHESQLLSATT
jgi:hypothetical protein